MTRAIIDMGGYTLDLTYDDEVDLDDRFTATCNDTGEKLAINGWLIYNVEVVL